jgi:molybdopterin-guanine dinucleotide biosynthesis protein A
MESRLVGVIMCGGLSTRMGKDKGLIIEQGVTWVERTHQKLSNLKIPVYISVNEAQVSGYRKILPCEILIPDTVEIPGPLKGILTAFIHLRGKDLLVMATDLQDISVDSISALLQRYYLSKPQYDIYAYSNKGRPEPLMAIYTHTLLEKIYNTALKGGLVNYSLQHILKKENTSLQELHPGQEKDFKNYNSPADLKQL